MEEITEKLGLFLKATSREVDACVPITCSIGQWHFVSFWVQMDRNRNERNDENALGFLVFYHMVPTGDE